MIATHFFGLFSSSALFSSVVVSESLFFFVMQNLLLPIKCTNPTLIGKPKSSRRNDTKSKPSDSLTKGGILAEMEVVFVFE